MLVKNDISIEDISYYLLLILRRDGKKLSKAKKCGEKLKKDWKIRGKLAKEEKRYCIFLHCVRIRRLITRRFCPLASARTTA